MLGLEIYTPIKSLPVSESAKEVIVSLEAGENISALKLVYVGADNKAYLARHNGTYEQALAVAMSKTAIGTGLTGQFLVFGKIVDPFFAYAGTQELFLTTFGNISNTAPATGHVTSIGQSLGSGAIFLNIKKTVVL